MPKKFVLKNMKETELVLYKKYIKLKTMDISIWLFRL